MDNKFKRTFCELGENKRNEYWTDWIGCKVRKDKKPFKSGNKVNTVNTFTTNPNTGHEAFTFLEDDSIVDCHKCYLVEDEQNTRVIL